MKSAMLAALCFAGFALAADPEVNDTPKVQTQEPPRAGHYVTICDGRSCRQVFVPDGPAQAAYSTAPVAALPPPATFYLRGSPQTVFGEDGTCTETRVKFMKRGPIRRFFSRR